MHDVEQTWEYIYISFKYLSSVINHTTTTCCTNQRYINYFKTRGPVPTSRIIEIATAGGCSLNVQVGCTTLFIAYL